jgi:hypothetical protein
MKHFLPEGGFDFDTMVTGSWGNIASVIGSEREHRYGFPRQAASERLLSSYGFRCKQVIDFDRGQLPPDGWRDGLQEVVGLGTCTEAPGHDRVGVMGRGVGVFAESHQIWWWRSSVRRQIASKSCATLAQEKRCSSNCRAAAATRSRRAASARSRRIASANVAASSATR